MMLSSRHDHHRIGHPRLAIAFGVGGLDSAKKWWAKYATPKGSTPVSRSTDHQQ